MVDDVFFVFPFSDKNCTDLSLIETGSCHLFQQQSLIIEIILIVDSKTVGFLIVDRVSDLSVRTTVWLRLKIFGPHVRSQLHTYVTLSHKKNATKKNDTNAPHQQPHHERTTTKSNTSHFHRPRFSIPWTIDPSSVSF